MKGYLDVKDLEKYKKADLQALARDLGVSDEGTIKEIAARCAAVEVEIPDEAATTEGQQPPTEGQQPPTEGQQPPTEGQQPPTAPTKGDMVTVKIIKNYKDLVLKRTVRKGECLPMDKARASVIVSKKLGEITVEE